MLVLVLIILLPPFGSFFDVGIYVMDIAYSLLILISVLYTSSNRKQLFISGFLGSLTFLIYWLNRNLDLHNSINVINVLVTFSFFAYVQYQLIRNILHEKKVSLNTIYAATSGYLIIGILGAQLFILLEGFFPGSLHLAGTENYYDFFYFSFISLTTVGYGDITPVHPTSKSISILISIAGQVYLTVFIAVIIGQFITTGKKS